VAASELPEDGEPVAKLPPEELIWLTPNEWTIHYWEEAARHQLVVPRCVVCGTYRFPPSPFCYVCQNQEVEWVEQPGRGTVYSYTVAWHPLLPDVRGSVPYIPVVVELPDTGGVRLVGDMVDVRPSEVHIGMEVELVWRDVREGVSVPTFRPARNGQ